MSHPLQRRYLAMSAAERITTASAVGVSTETLRQMIMAYRTGGQPSVSPDVAQRIEKALGVKRETICGTCASCTILKAHRKGVKK